MNPIMNHVRVLLRLLALLLAMIAAPANADELRPGYLEFTQVRDTEWALVWKSPMKGGVTPQTRPVLPAGCKIQGLPERELVNMSLVIKFAVMCSDDVAGKSIGLSGFDTSQTDVLVRVASLGRPAQAMRLTAAKPFAEILAKPGAWQVAWTYFVTGAQHIVFGYDHLLFVLAMVLLLRGGWTVAKAVTAFTLAHSITLIGTTMGLFGLPQRPVEVVIALSIMFLAAEIIKRDPGNPRLSERIPWVVAFIFGLLHGFGFAGALQEIGLPEDDVPVALMTFNLGVEAGQLAIVLAGMLALVSLRRFAEPLMKPAIVAAAYAIGTIASFLFIERFVA
jgi:hydrogenase/urease accessory protein HupE